MLKCIFKILLRKYLLAMDLKFQNLKCEDVEVIRWDYEWITDQITIIVDLKKDQFI